MELSEDTFYLLATGFSLLSIIAVILIRYWFGNDSGEKKTNQVGDSSVIRGSFGKAPITEWKQHKLALEREYRDRFMDCPTDQTHVGDDDEMTPLIRKSPENSGQDDHAAPKTVRFNDTISEKRLTDEDDGSNLAEEQPTQILGEDADEVLNAKMDEDDLAHLPGQLKSVKLRKATEEVEAGLTDEEKREEIKIRAQQLESILNLMRQQQEKFGASSMEDIEEQLKLYSF